MLKLFQNYFSDIEHVCKYSCAAISLLNYSEIILGKIVSDGTLTKAEIIYVISPTSRCAKTCDRPTYLLNAAKTMRTIRKQKNSIHI